MARCAGIIDRTSERSIIDNNDRVESTQRVSVNPHIQHVRRGTEYLDMNQIHQILKDGELPSRNQLIPLPTPPDGRSGSKTARLKEKFTCRICLSDGSIDEEDEGLNEDNPLISPCNCAGTMKFIHLEWLRGWLNSKRHSRETLYVNSYYWKNIQCELWKTLFPSHYTF